MKVRTNLFLLSAIFAILIGALGFIVFQSFGLINREMKGSISANKMIKDVFELNIVTYEYLMHHKKRMQQQWILKYDSLGKLLERMRKEESHPEGQSILESITSDYKALGSLYSQLQATFVKRKKLLEENRPQGEINMIFALEERLIAQTLMRTQKITSGAFRSSIIMQQRIARVRQRTNWIVLFSIIGFIILSSCVSFLITRSITRPLNKLANGAELIGKGDLNHRVDIKTKNEIGELADAFNHMTERRQLAEETLRKSEAKYQDLFDSAPAAYFSVGIDGLIKGANKAAENLTGYRSEELQKMKVFNLYAEESKEKAKGLFEKFKRGISWENEEMIYERKGGQKIHGLLSISLIKDENGLVLESRSVVVDITERKQVEEELEKHRNHLEEMVGIRTAELDKRISEVEQLNSAMVNLMEDLRVSNDSLVTRTQQLVEANKELDAFAYSVSHDLRAPLRAIDGFSQMLTEDYGDKLDEGGQHQLDVIQNSARQMGQLIDDLLAFSRLGRRELKMSNINIQSLAEEVFEQQQISETERTTQLAVEELPQAIGDRAMIREVLVNLFSNALKYSASQDSSFIGVAGRVEGDESIYSVKDNGVGFDMKYADKLFQVFQRLHSTEEFEGTGIGLALVQRIVHRHGGRVWAEGKVDEGATFYFSLPRS